MALIDSLIDPDDSLERRNEKLCRIVEALMRRVEQGSDRSGAAYRLFERAALLEDQVRERTSDLERTLDLLNITNARLEAANRETERARADLTSAIEAIEEGFALFGEDDTLVHFNSRFSVHMPDVQAALRPGLSFAAYVDVISMSPHRDWSDGGTPQDWALRRMMRHRESHVMFNVRLADDRWIQVSEHRTPNGGTAILQTDVTDLMRAEREERGRILDGQERLMRATLDHIRQGVCIFDAQARIVGWNRRMIELFFLGQERIPPRASFAAVLTMLRPYLALPDDHGVDDLVAWADLEGGRPPLNFEVTVSDARTLATHAQETPGGGFLISFTDVTDERSAARVLAETNESLERRVLERTLELEDAVAAAERANASKTRFVAAASHDLLQPLSAAKLYMAALVGDAERASDREMAMKAEGALESAETMINALLDISKLDSGAAKIEPRWFGLDDVLRPLRDEFAPIAAARGLDFTVVFSRATVHSDPALLRRVLQNLIGNAIRYTPAGRVLVGARRTGGSLRVEVRDTGIGVAPEDQDAIFDEFKKVGGRASASEGLGLGLAIVDRACARLGHPLGLSSALGEGSTFAVTVKRKDAPRTRRPWKTPRATLTPGAFRIDGLDLLLVENDLELRKAVAHLIENWGATVFDAAGPEDAFALLEDGDVRPDAMLIDFQLDDGADGVALATRLLETLGDVPTRIISADRSLRLRRRCAAAGLTFLNKPLSTDALQSFLSAAETERRTLKL